MRPGDQPLDRLVSPEAYRKLRAADEVVTTATNQQAYCAELLRMIDRTVILDRAQAGRLVVNQDLWGRFPGDAKTAIVRCVRSMQSTPTSELQIVETTPEEFAP